MAKKPSPPSMMASNSGQKMARAVSKVVKSMGLPAPMPAPRESRGIPRDKPARKLGR